MTLSRNAAIAIILLLVAAAGGWYASRQLARTNVANLDSKGTTIVAFGDSLVYGYGATPGRDFVSVLSSRIGTAIVNLGRNGDTTTDGLARLDDVFKQNPKVVIILLGGNDFLKKVPKETTFSNLGTMIDAIQARGAAVLLLGVRGGLLSDTYAGSYKALAESHRAAHVPNVLAGLLGRQEYMYDQIHPNDAGYAKIADKVEPVLRKMLDTR